MGMQQKIERAYQEGYTDGKAAANKELFETARTQGIVQGTLDTLEELETMIPQLEGIGPKTKDKIMRGIQKYVATSLKG